MTQETLRVVNAPRKRTVKRAAGDTKSQIISLSPTEKRLPAPTTYNTYLNMYKQHPVVRAAIDKIAKAATGAGYTFKPRDSKQPLNENAAAEIALIFSRSRGQFLLRTIYTDLMIYGDAFIHVVKARNGVPYSLQRVAPQSLTLVWDEAAQVVSQVIQRDDAGKETAFPGDEWIRFRLFDPNNDIYGLSPLESLKGTVTQDLFAAQFNASFFENAAQTGVIFNMRGASREEIERNREFLKQEYVSVDNAHKPILLEGDVSVQRSVSTPAEMEFIKGREFLRDEILAVLDVPKTKIGGTESANRSQSTENDKSFRVENIQPLQGIVEDEFNETLVWDFLKIEDTVFSHNDVDMRDEKDRMDVDISGLTHGVATINEMRSSRGLSPVDGGDIAFVQTASGIVPVKDIENLIKSQQALAEAKVAQASVAQNPADATGQAQDQNKNLKEPTPNPPQPDNTATRK